MLFGERPLDTRNEHKSTTMSTKFPIDRIRHIYASQQRRVFKKETDAFTIVTGFNI